MQFSKILATAALVVCFISTADAQGCAAERLNLGPISLSTLEIGASAGGNRLLQASSTETSFSVDTAGVGQATGAAFTVPAFSQANVSIALGVPALTSEQVRNLRDAWEAILDASQRESLREYERQDRTASRNLGFLGWFCGGKTTRTSTTTRTNMESRGLTPDQITQILETFNEIALAMSDVELQFTIFNQNNPYAVSGNVLVWVMSGTITTTESQTQYRVISDGGVATGDQGNSNAGGDIIPLVL